MLALFKGFIRHELERCMPAFPWHLEGENTTSRRDTVDVNRIYAAHTISREDTAGAVLGALTTKEPLSELKGGGGGGARGEEGLSENTLWRHRF